MTALGVHVLGVREDAEAIAEQLAAAGHTVSGPQKVSDDQVADAIRDAPGADVVVLVGSIDPSSALPGRVEAACELQLPGFGELARRVLFEVDGARAALLRPCAGQIGDRAVYLVPGPGPATERIVAELVLPNLTAAPVAAAAAAKTPEKAASSTSSDEETLPAGIAHRATDISLSATLDHVDAPATPEEEELPNRGWKRAVADLGAEVFLGKHEDLPEPIEKLAPVVNVLHTAGEFGMMKLPSGRRYSLFGWPDLRRANSKVLAVSWGDPLAEVVALHRHPDHAGTLIPGKNGLLASQDSNADALSETVVGRAGPTIDGTPFAVDKGTVWLMKGRRVMKWDGSKERDDGNPKQVLASLTLHWSNL